MFVTGIVLVVALGGGRDPDRPAASPHVLGERSGHSAELPPDDDRPSTADDHFGVTVTRHGRRRLRYQRYRGLLPAARVRQPAADAVAGTARVLGENRTGGSALRSGRLFRSLHTVQLSVPGGPDGIRSRSGQGLSTTLRKNFVIEGGSELRLQQLLAELGYLPLQFVPAPSTGGNTVDIAALRSIARQAYQHSTTTTAASVPAIDSEPPVAAEVPVQALAGSLLWRFSDTPSSLAALWKPGVPNVITTGAIMAFEGAHGLTVDGEAGPRVWTALLQAVARRQVTTSPYDYVVVNQTIPETASVWRDGQIIFTTLVNTGIAVAPTAPGTYPVFARYLVTTMTGKNPDGKPYSDPGIPWVSYFNGGDALHGYTRASYGFPQSLGCVEMTYANAETMFGLTPLGTLVTVLASPVHPLRGST